MSWGENKGEKGRRQRDRRKKQREERGRGSEQEERKQREGEIKQRSRVTVRKRDTDRGVEPPSALYSSRTKEITEEATITIGFTFFQNQGTSRGGQHHHRLFLLQNHERSRVGQHNHRPPFSKNQVHSFPFLVSVIYVARQNPLAIFLLFVFCLVR